MSAAQEARNDHENFQMNMVCLIDRNLQVNIVERPSDCHAIIHQLHRRIWPSNPRESLFWSQKADVSKHKNPDALDAWMVCNHNCDRDIPVSL